MYMYNDGWVDYSYAKMKREFDSIDCMIIYRMNAYAIIVAFFLLRPHHDHDRRHLKEFPFICQCDSN